MKKLFFAMFLIVGIFGIMVNAWGNCVSLPPGTTPPSNNSELNIRGVGVYICGSGYCSASDSVISKAKGWIHARPYPDPGIYTCLINGNHPKWKYEEIQPCQDPRSALQNVSNHVKEYVNKRGFVPIFGGGNVAVLSGQGDICWRYGCAAGFMIDDPTNPQKCIISLENECTSTGGSWNTTLNTCDCTSNTSGRTTFNNRTHECQCPSNAPHWDPTTNTCVGNVPPPPPPPVSSCRQNRASVEGKACCDWPIAVATWTNGECVCKDPNQHFVITDWTRAYGHCEPTNPTPPYVPPFEALCSTTGGNWDPDTKKCNCPGEAKWNSEKGCFKPFKCSPEQLANLETWSMDYADNISLNSQIQALLDYCNGDSVTQEGFNQRLQAILAAIENVKTEKINAAREASRARIKESASRLDNWIDDFKANTTVWKNEEGKFNTTRLLSDTAAAVVLGTTGGLVTSKVMKKNQIKKGFENIHCTVGGQEVADWGDEFQVGVH